MARTSYSVGPAAHLLGMSIPTLKRKCEAGEIPHFFTPGGHLRIPSDAVERLLGGKPAPTVRDPSSALRGADRQEELGLTGQESRMRRETERSRAKPAEGKEMLPARVRSPELQTNADLEGTRLASERSLRLVSQERESEEVRYRPGEFHRHWRGAADDLLPSWLSFEQHEEAIEALDRVIARCSERDERRMPQVLREAIGRLLAPLEKERQVAMRREQLLQRAQESIVLVNGKIGYDHGNLTGTKAGRAFRGSGSHPSAGRP